MPPACQKPRYDKAIAWLQDPFVSCALSHTAQGPDANDYLAQLARLKWYSTFPLKFRRRKNDWFTTRSHLDDLVSHESKYTPSETPNQDAQFTKAKHVWMGSTPLMSQTCRRMSTVGEMLQLLRKGILWAAMNHDWVFASTNAEASRNNLSRSRPQDAVLAIKEVLAVIANIQHMQDYGWQESPTNVPVLPCFGSAGPKGEGSSRLFKDVSSLSWMQPGSPGSVFGPKSL